MPTTRGGGRKPSPRFMSPEQAEIVTQGVAHCVTLLAVVAAGVWVQVGFKVWDDFTQRGGFDLGIRAPRS